VETLPFQPIITMQHTVHHSNKQQLYPKYTASTSLEFFLSSLLSKSFS